MAENSMCGPSNALKGFSNHVNQDRSLQQGRVYNGPSGPHQASFRSQQPQTSHNDFANFQARASLPGQMPVFNASPIQQAPVSQQFAPMPSQAHQAQRQTPNNWVQDFQSMNLRASPGPATMSTHQPGHLAMGDTTRQLAMPGQPTYRTMPDPYQHMMHQNATERQRDTLIRSQLGKFVNNPEADLGGWQLDGQTKDAFESDFASEMNAWVAKNGPNAQESINASIDKGFEDAIADALEADRQKEAEQQQQQPKSQTPPADPHLAEAARQVVTAVSDNQSDKFKNSRFFDLMRQVGQNQVILNGENFVNAADGSNYDTTSSRDSPVGDGTAARG